MDNFRYYIRDDTPVEVAESVLRTLQAIKEEHDCDYTIIKIEELSKDEQEDVLENIRILSRRNTIGVVSKGRGSLPISRKKNLSNVGILVHSRDGKDIAVYPNVKNNK
ncbi:DUF91 domain-containing protein, partial [Methanococcoides sp. SA1]|nr:DUF91 domain-containing protein [Methanococcoides sp. SA1]